MSNETNWRCRFHMLPPKGWLNDPNGLCQFQGTYHVFFQYTPEFPRQELRAWGHYASSDLLHFRFTGIALKPDSPYDRTGAFSGSACTEADTIALYYTGNVELEGEHDYTHSGRESNTLRVTTRNGIQVSEKICVLDNSNYPAGYTCHIRDPKVWKEGDTYYMVLGARRLDDSGAILLYQSQDGLHWKLFSERTSRQPFGFMWECPDLFQMDGKTFLSFCPQGIPAEPYRFQNLHQSGYLPFCLTSTEPIDETVFREWDMGFDFYAPQTFQDEQGRRILIGWAGGPETTYQEPTLKQNWIHTLTLPRQITCQQGILKQMPLPEFNELRSQCQELPSGQWYRADHCFDWELELLPESEPAFSIHITEECKLSYSNGILTLQFTGKSGAGRTRRQVRCETIRTIRILADCSILECFFNDGAIVMTTRFFPEDSLLPIRADGAFQKNILWTLDTKDCICTVLEKNE